MKRPAALAVLAWGSACGGNVVVDGMPDGSGGAGATSASTNSVEVASSGVTSTSSGWTTTSAVTSSATGVGGGDAWSLCVSYCELLQESCGPVAPDGCISECDGQLALAPDCNDLLVPFFDCAMPDAGRCDAFPFRCQQHLDRYEKCASGSAPGSDCEPFACSGGPGGRTCDCKGSCPGLDFAAECRPSGPGPGEVVCSCLIDGITLTSCDGSGSACDLAESCCGPIFEEFR
ncbi:hypothetical protein [Sorangium sp. So ce1151]|uniref:hypothetical protein n=1 Tax=Sorangium sp. So ce1151 TaxID=3133332 RepID=UPI003F608E1A